MKHACAAAAVQQRRRHHVFRRHSFQSLPLLLTTAVGAHAFAAAVAAEAPDAVMLADACAAVVL